MGNYVEKNEWFHKATDILKYKQSNSTRDFDAHCCTVLVLSVVLVFTFYSRDIIGISVGSGLGIVLLILMFVATYLKFRK